MSGIDYTFRKEAGHILESRQTQALVLHGNIHGLFHLPQTQSLDDKTQGSYVTLLDYLKAKWNVQGTILIVQQQNGALDFVSDTDRAMLRNSWMVDRTGRAMGASARAVQQAFNPEGSGRDVHPNEDFDTLVREATGSPAIA
ncbi:MAG: hypothetical protein AAFX99_23245, partial [Myxococcota bacterium]